MNKIKVLIVDDMALVREVLAQGLSQDPMIEVVATAADPFIARDRIIEHKPDVMTLDVEMPKMDGVEFLQRLMPQYPIPVVMVSSLTERGQRITLDALQAGAVDFVTKPKADVARGLSSMMAELRAKIKIASTANVSHRKRKRTEAQAAAPAVLRCGQALAVSTDKVIAIGASTGGTEAIKEVVTRFPATAPGVVIVQHMPTGFTRLFAERLNTLCAMDVKEAADEDRVMPGRILIAPGGSHMSLVRSGGVYRVRVETGDLVNGHCPSVEVLFRSVARFAAANAVGVMLTGMGGDGADGLKVMRDAGARTFAQDEATCVVFGMPKVAWERGGVEELVPISEMADKVLDVFA
jgi:two-component system, chemotaxis family, protein-glutamate methylesterase/glutaminase